LYDAFIIDARGVYAGEVNAIAIRAYWTLKRQDLSETELTEAQIHFDQLGMNECYGWIFPVSAARLDQIECWGWSLVRYQKINTNIIQLLSSLSRATKLRQMLSR